MLRHCHCGFHAGCTLKKDILNPDCAVASCCDVKILAVPTLSGFPDFVPRHIYEYSYVTKSVQLRVSLRFSAPRYGFYCTIWAKKRFGAFVEERVTNEC
jgi:hypothetical protein